jgi:ribosomal 30S subunit maturation factor RimM
MTKTEREVHYNNFRIMYNRLRWTNQFRKMKDLDLILFVKENPKVKDAQDEFYYRRLWDTKEGRKKLGDREEI